MTDDYKKISKNILADTEVILASNRGPYNFGLGKGGNLIEKRGGGGLVSAFLSLLDDIDLTWLSLARTNSDSKIGLKGKNVGKKKKSTAKFISLNENIYSAYYNNICNEVLWFVQHGLCDAVYKPVFDGKINDDWQSYELVNKCFGKVITDILKKSQKEKAIVLLQDYHLYLTSLFLPRHKNILVSHFTHIPWPGVENISIFPKKILTDILKGLLGNDLVSFHCENYVQNFLNTCDEFGFDIDRKNKLVNFNGRHVPVRAFPISIDEVALCRESYSNEVKNYEQKFKKNIQGQFIFRADRIDPSKNIIRGFLSFERLLKLFPEFCQKVTFVTYLYESRQKIKTYKKYLKTIKKTAENINKRYAIKKWQPIKLRVADNYQETLAAFKHFDVLLVNSIADGMNLVAKEGILLNKNNGVLILSTRTGVHNEFGGLCLTVNPFDIHETAIKMKDALLMPRKERKTRSEMLKNIVSNNNSKKWLYHQLGTLTASKK